MFMSMLWGIGLLAGRIGFLRYRVPLKVLQGVRVLELSVFEISSGVAVISDFPYHLNKGGAFVLGF